MKLIIILVLLMITLINAFSNNVLKVNMRRSIVNMSLQYDSQGYVIKPRDWFNGLSTDPGGSLTGTYYHLSLLSSLSITIVNRSSCCTTCYESICRENKKVIIIISIKSYHYLIIY